MHRIFQRITFLRFLLPLICGVLFQYYIDAFGFLIPVFCIGLVAVFLSFLKSVEESYKWRWLYGLGIYICIFCLGAFSTVIRQQKSSYTFSEDKNSYVGYIQSIPEPKNKTIACEIFLPSNNKKILGYFQKGIRSRQLEVGDEIVFYGKIDKFRTLGNPDDFDYVKYMYNKGFSGTIYLTSDNWEATGNIFFSVQTYALSVRQSILRFYRIFQLPEKEYAILAALTLGDKTFLSDDIKESFRTTGTSHVLAVSGLHVGIIFGMVLFIFSFLLKGRSKKYTYIFSIVCLVAYSFITGLSPSVTRASIMLIIFCIAQLFHKRNTTYNSIFLAAFWMLLFNPFYLFDVGFQLSFVAVFSILLFQPFLSSVWKVENRPIRFLWNAFTVSIAAQLGTLPLCLYYFGTFPAYFFITNIFVALFIPLIICSSILLGILGFILVKTTIFPEAFYLYPAKITSFLIHLMMDIIHWFEKLPFALIENLQLYFWEVFLLFFITIICFLFFRYRKAKYLLLSLGCTLIFLTMRIGYKEFLSMDYLTIYYQPENPDVRLNLKGKEQKLILVENYNLLEIGKKTFLSITSNNWKNLEAQEKIKIDYLHIVKNDTISLYSLTRLFDLQYVILDGSLSANKSKTLEKECDNLNIPCFNVREKGMFRINF